VCPKTKYQDITTMPAPLSRHQSIWIFYRYYENKEKVTKTLGW